MIALFTSWFSVRQTSLDNIQCCFIGSYHTGSVCRAFRIFFLLQCLIFDTYIVKGWEVSTPHRDIWLGGLEEQAGWFITWMHRKPASRATVQQLDPHLSSAFFSDAELWMQWIMHPFWQKLHYLIRERWRSCLSEKLFANTGLKLNTIWMCSLTLIQSCLSILSTLLLCLC